jgi:hypothetical protein
MPYGIAGRMPTSLVSARLDRTKMGYIILNTLIPKYLICIEKYAVKYRVYNRQRTNILSIENQLLIH